MKIQKIERIEWELYITLEDITQLDKVDYILIDSIGNIKNVESNLDSAHTQKIEDFDISEDNEIVLSLDDLEVDNSAFIVTLRSYEEETDLPFHPYFYYNKKEVFYREVQLLLDKCDTCLDEESKFAIAMFILKRQLLEEAQEMQWMNDCVKFYLDIARLLRITVNTAGYRAKYLYDGKGPSTTGYMQHVNRHYPKVRYYGR